MRYDKKTGETFNYRMMMVHVPVQVMYRKVEKQVRQLQEKKGK
ncbi:hypothetical protein [Enterococcus gallinarum]|nr:hypothetical protein [Enterococcus gallinarum]OJG48023.1 hypothetical protein RV03_GL001470 [Enterococcus gallinarum]